MEWKQVMTGGAEGLPKTEAPVGQGSSPSKAALSPAQRIRQDETRRRRLRAGVQIVFFVLAPALFSSGFAGVKQIFSAVAQGEPLAWTGFVRILVALCVLTVLFGRFFCGYVCAFGSLGDGVHFVSEKIQKKSGKKLPPLPAKAAVLLQYLPFAVLTAIVVLCGLGVYSSLHGWSPWDVFSRFTTGNLDLAGYGLGLVLFLLILVGMAWVPRFFCRFLCPMGAVFRLLPIAPWATLRSDRERCLAGCTLCSKNCPVGTCPHPGENAGSCIHCGKCSCGCPRDNIRTGIKRLRGDEWWLVVGEAVLFFGAAVLLSVSRLPF